MIDLLEVTGDDISKLNDSDLRDLIGRLCEADYKLSLLSTKGIYWGGHQDAPDGGFDVYVNHFEKPPKNSFIPSKIAGFQIKKPNMTPSAIKKEMCPKGTLREEIKDLINIGGAYIIASSSSSTSKSALDNRLNMMQECVKEKDPKNKLRLEFYDQGQIATWVRNHKALIIWVRNKIGRPIKGWQPFSNWSYPKGSIEDKFITDDELKLYIGNKESDSGETILSGINTLRKELSTPKSSIRLVGLSGVGKTRLVEALFDNRIEENALDRNLVIYTDVSDSPIPDPKTLSEQLAVENARAIIIVDNCSPELHRKLTLVITSSRNLSLLTVEYDVKGDLPDETSVYRLEPANDNAIESFIKSRYKHINYINIRTIINLAGGNFRLVVALANTIKKNESQLELKDEVLFERIFIQRNTPDSKLLFSAEVLSLVYSFEGTNTSEHSEIGMLASLIGLPASNLYRDIETLKRRNLIQSRARWRALLPHALSNKLAKSALDSIPIDSVVKVFLDENNNGRLLLSFTHRLSFLYDHKKAQEIANVLLKLDSFLGKLNGRLTYDQVKMFKYLAPVSPETTLKMFEFWSSGENEDYFTSRENKLHYEYTRILRNIAYDPKFFSRSVDIIIKFVLKESPTENRNPTRPDLARLFQLQLSGTHAKVENRLKTVKRLLDSHNSEEQDLGLYLLKSLFKSSSFVGTPSHEVNSGNRDYGMMADTYQEYLDWYLKVIAFLRQYVFQKNDIVEKIKKELTINITLLIRYIGLPKELEVFMLDLYGESQWMEGWLALKSLLANSKEKFNEEFILKIRSLEEKLRPKSLEEKIRVYTLSTMHRFFDLEEDYLVDEPWSETDKRTSKFMVNLGTQLANDREVFEKLVPELITNSNRKLRYLGQGLFLASSNRSRTWGTINIVLSKASKDEIDVELIFGFLEKCALLTPRLHDLFLDRILNSKSPLLEWFPRLQATKKIDRRAIIRLINSLKLNRTNLNNYYVIGIQYNIRAISDKDFIFLLNTILNKPDGYKASLNILETIVYQKEKFPEPLSDIVFKTLHGFDFDEYQYPYILAHLNEVACHILKNDSDDYNVGLLCENIITALRYDLSSDHPLKETLITIAEKKPFVFLDTAFGDTNLEMSYSVSSLLKDNFMSGGNPIDSINTKSLVEWARVNSTERYLVLSNSINLIRASQGQNIFYWKTFVFSMLEDIKDNETLKNVLDNMKSFTRPRSYTGSWAVALQTRVSLYTILINHNKKIVSDWASEGLIKLNKDIEASKDRDSIRTRRDMESFE